VRLIGKGNFFNSYKMIADGSSPEEKIDIVHQLVILTSGQLE
jgi:hypothetical protein